MSRNWHYRKAVIQYCCDRYWKLQTFQYSQESLDGNLMVPFWYELFFVCYQRTYIFVRNYLVRMFVLLRKITIHPINSFVNIYLPKKFRNSESKNLVSNYYSILVQCIRHESNSIAVEWNILCFRMIWYVFYRSGIFDMHLIYSIGVEQNLYEFDAEFDNPEVGKFDHL